MSGAALPLSGVAAGTCPLKTWRAYAGDPVADQPGVEYAARTAGARAAFRSEVLQRWADAHPAGVADLRGLADGPEKVRDCLDALRAGVDLVLDAALPGIAGPAEPGEIPTVRSGSPDVLVRAPSGGYLPVLVRWHRVLARRRDDDGAELRQSTLERPQPAAAVADPTRLLRFGTREGDFLELAHHRRQLESLGLAAAEGWAGIIGTDGAEGTDDADQSDQSGHGPPEVAWVDLTLPQIRTFSRSSPQGWRLRTLLERYDHEYAFRARLAALARTHSAQPIAPVVIRECARCPWWPTCRAQLDGDDLGRRLMPGSLDVRETLALRALGIATVAGLHACDLDELLPRYLPEVRHRDDAEYRIRIAHRRAAMLVEGRLVERDSTGRFDVPGAQIEIDLDIETSADGRIYLWGFEVQAAGRPPRYVAFSRFADLDPGAELDLAREALGWLRRQVEAATGCRVYHYSGYEVVMIAALAARAQDELLDWAAAYAQTDFIDLLEIVKANFLGSVGLGLKQVARHAGFTWRDGEPNGLNSQRWFRDAVHADSADERAAARRRVLDYNEDDVIATARVRAWLRAEATR